MNKFSKDEHGFGAVEMILILVIIGVIGFVGWYVWHTKQTTDKTTQTITKVVDTATTQHENTITFTELNFQIKVPDTLKDLTYTVFTPFAGSTGARLSTTSLKTLDPACAPDGPNGTPLGWFIKTPGQYPKDATQAAGPLLHQYSSYYITYTTPQAACSTNKTAEDLAIKQTKELKDALNASNYTTKIQ